MRRRSIRLHLASLGIAVCAAVPAFGQTDGRLLLDPWEGSDAKGGGAAKHFEFEGSTALAEKAGLDNGQQTQFTAVRGQGRFRFGTDLELNPSVGTEFTHFELSKTALLPSQLDDVSVAFATPLAGRDDWFLGASVGLGYAGDNAFGNSDAWYGKAVLMYGRKLSGGDQLLLALDYDGNHTLFPEIPIPTIVYLGTIGKTFDYALGAPFGGFTWRPDDSWKISMEYQLPFGITAEARYQIIKPLSVFAGFTQKENAFHVTGDPDTRRLFYEESRAELGVTWQVVDDLSLTCAAGYAFDRTFSRGFDDRDLNRITDVDDQAYLRLGFSVQF